MATSTIRSNLPLRTLPPSTVLQPSSIEKSQTRIKAEDVASLIKPPTLGTDQEEMLIRNIERFISTNETFTINQKTMPRSEFLSERLIKDLSNEIKAKFVILFLETPPDASKIQDALANMPPPLDAPPPTAPINPKPDIIPPPVVTQPPPVSSNPVDWSTVRFFGDSYFSQGGVITQLESIIVPKKITPNSTTGLIGKSSDEVTQAAMNDLKTQANGPGVIVLECGINDLHKATQQNANATVDTIIKNMQAVITEAQAKQKKVVLVTLPQAKGVNNHESIESLNTKIKNLQTSNPDSVFIADASTMTIDKTASNSSGIHPGPEGYKSIAKLVEKAVESAMTGTSDTPTTPDVAASTTTPPPVSGTTNPPALKANDLWSTYALKNKSNYIKNTEDVQEFIRSFGAPDLKDKALSAFKTLLNVNHQTLTLENLASKENIIMDIQKGLTRNGYICSIKGLPDGKFGQKTMVALLDYLSTAATPPATPPATLEYQPALIAQGLNEDILRANIDRQERERLSAITNKSDLAVNNATLIDVLVARAKAKDTRLTAEDDATLKEFFSKYMGIMHETPTSEQFTNISPNEQLWIPNKDVLDRYRAEKKQTDSSPSDDLGATSGVSGGEHLVTKSAMKSQVSTWIESALSSFPDSEGRLTPNMLLAQMGAESSFKADAVSPAGAGGIAQFMPGTAYSEAKDILNQQINVPENVKSFLQKIVSIGPAPERDQRNSNFIAIKKLLKTHPDSPQSSAYLMVNFMTNLMKTFDNKWKFALAAYNAGPNAVAGGWDKETKKPVRPHIPNFKETIDYVDKIERRRNKLDQQVSLSGTVDNIQAASRGALAHALAGIGKDSHPRNGREVPGVVTGFQPTSTSGKKQISLTFDLCPPSGDVSNNKYFNVELIQHLIDKGIKATFFINQKWLDANRKSNPDAVKLLENHPELFQLANHGVDHKPLSAAGGKMYKILATRSFEEAYHEIIDNSIIDPSGNTYFRSGTDAYTQEAVAYCKERYAKEHPGKQLVIVSSSVREGYGDQGGGIGSAELTNLLTHTKTGEILLCHANNGAQNRKNNPMPYPTDAFIAALDAMLGNTEFVRLNEVSLKENP